MSKKSGFTLIELLVSITILAVLAAVGLVVYSRVISEGRDSKRQSDLRSIQSALEQYFADQLYYPLVGASCSNGTFRVNCALKDPTGQKTYMNTVPSDPVGSTQYLYQALPFEPSPACDNSSKKCTSYCLSARLENSNPGTGNCTDNQRNFAVTPP